MFLATDTITSRLVANAIVQSHFIPMVQIGAKVDLRAEGGIESVYVAVRPVFPGRGCLDCAGLISPEALQREAATEEERAAQDYLGLPEVIDPSVITLNGVGADGDEHHADGHGWTRRRRTGGPSALRCPAGQLVDAPRAEGAGVWHELPLALRSRSGLQARVLSPSRLCDSAEFS